MENYLSHGVSVPLIMLFPAGSNDNRSIHGGVRMGTGQKRNIPCPCGSGKKYKNCCFNKPDDPDMYNLSKMPQIFVQTFKAARIKQCIFPNHSECSEKIIGAHSIQNNRILTRIADNGKVLMPYGKPNNPFAIMTSWGRKEASVFTGFCGFHDKAVFQPIENTCFTASDEQVFLFTYRTFARDYHKKMESVKFNQELFKRKQSLINMPAEENMGYITEVAVKDLEVDKKIFDQSLLEKKYDCLTYFVWELSGSCKFAASGTEAPTFDLEKHRIQDLCDVKKSVANIYYTVFPDECKTICIIAWMKRNDALFSSIHRQLTQLNDKQRRNYINNTIPLCAENIAINPSAWEALSKTQKEEFRYLYFTSDASGIAMNDPLNRLRTPSFDLFSL